MGTIILLVLLLWSIWVNIRGLWRVSEVDMLVYLKEGSESKTYLLAGFILIAVVRVLLDIWGALVVGTGIAMVGCAVVILIMLKMDIWQYGKWAEGVKQRKEKLTVKPTVAYKCGLILVTAFDTYLVYVIVARLLG